MTVTDESSIGAFLVPAALALPSNRAYLAHLAASTSNPDLIRLASNENTEPPSPRVREALERAFTDANLSPPPTSPLQVALAERHGVDTAQVLVTAGSTEVIDAVFRTFLRAGSEVVLPDPSWPVFRRRLEALEAHIVDIPLSRSEDGFRYDAPLMLAEITSETRLVVICTPNNPTGNAMELADIRRIADTGVPLLLDAAYADFDPARDPMHLAHEYDNLIITRTFSKAYCLAGVRVGYAVGNAALLDYVDRFLVPGSSVSGPALHAGHAAFEDEGYHQLQVERITRERERLLPLLRGLGLRAYASGGNFLPVDCSEPPAASAFAASVLAHNVVIRPLHSLVRISIGRREENDALVAAIARVIEAEGAP
ncbi:pyridoxal phosphate-dependent aminotransferase [Gaiella sp.]|uniref:pyridoxal phosphate-dependent aminotransferase n=1 Tax=Gaiella sp. TaxID=2663207 RepID=UPI0039836187